MKNIKETKNSTCGTCYICTRSQKIWACVVLCGIFVCGFMTGVSVWGYKHANTADSAVYSEKVSSCQMREKALLVNIHPDIDDTWSDAADLHKRNADVYDDLIRWGCEDNQKRYEELRDAEFSVSDVLKRTHDNENPCKVIENTLLNQIDNSCMDSSKCHLRNAAVYSKIVEDGCPDTQQKYARLALDELQIADGVRVNDGEVYQDEMRSTVNTYKKLQMQNEAKKYIKKVEKLVNPGIDFIMELQRVIEE